MNMGTPRREQGQAVERSYGWVDGALYRRTLDRSDGTEMWARADEESADALPEGYSPGGEDEPPAVSEWIACARPEED